jgi:hypothetical protein
MELQLKPSRLLAPYQGHHCTLADHPQESVKQRTLNQSSMIPTLSFTNTLEIHDIFQVVQQSNIIQNKCEKTKVKAVNNTRMEAQEV